MMRGLRLVTLDLTGTVFRFRKPVFEEYSEVAAALHGVQCDPLQVKKAFFAAFKSWNKREPNFAGDKEALERKGQASKAWWVGVVQDTFKGKAKTFSPFFSSWIPF